MKTIRPTILLACLWLLFSSCFTTTVNAETTGENPITSADLETIVEQENDTEATISYVLEDKKNLILKTDQAAVLNIDALKEELGAEKVDQKNELETVVTLDDPDAIDFKLHVDKEKPFFLTVLDADQVEVFKYQFNVEKKVARSVNDDAAEEATWTHAEKLRVSKGPIMEHSDGAKTQPIFYFGDYIYAEKGIVKVSSTWVQRRKSRENSLTSPNTGIIYSEAGGNLDEGSSDPKNHIYTNHYGDNQKKDYDAPLHDEEDLPFGTPTSYTSNNLFNFVVHSNNWLKPGTSGPNKLGKAYAMVGEPALYYRINQKTGFEEQRLVYKQRAFYSDKRGKTNPEITTTIKMSFTRTGRVITDISFKNTGKVLFNNFSGFSNHDLSLNKDGKELQDQRGRKIGNYIPMRSLTNDRGMYIQAPNNEVRTNFYMNHNDGPGAWAARSASRSYLATKGYMYNPGLLGLIGVQKETYYPWKVGKGQNNFFFDHKTNSYKFPYTPSGKFNAFKDQRDPGDKGKTRALGTRLGTDNENDPQWDAGLTMRTAPIDLKVGETKHLQYGTKTDIPGSNFCPVVEFDGLSYEDFPQVLPVGSRELTMKGHWYDFDSQKVKIYYALDSEKPEELKKNILLEGTQSKDEAENGTFHDFTKKINISELEKGLHKVRLIAEDEDGNQSVLQEHNFKLIKKAVANKGPQIDVTAPLGTKRKPYLPVTDKFDLHGFWSDGKNKMVKSLSYTIDGGEEKTFESNLQNPKLGQLVAWHIPDFDISEYNDFQQHRMVLKITDAEGMTDTDTFYFKHVGGGTHLVAPEEIDFGKVTVATKSDQAQKPDLKGNKVLLEDFRKEGATPLGVKLTVRKFYLQTDNPNDGDDEDDGDDSSTTIDPQTRSKESLVHGVLWDGQPVASKSFIVGRTEGAKDSQWRQTTDLSSEIEKKLKINFWSKESGATPGKYVSRWTWSTVDSVQ